MTISKPDVVQATGWCCRERPGRTQEGVVDRSLVPVVKALVIRLCSCVTSAHLLVKFAFT